MKTKNHPGVYPPPPLFYVLIFLSSLYVQKKIPLPIEIFNSKIAFSAGMLLLVSGLFILIPALYRFFKSKNTLITIKPANSLQTTGIYSVTRNPMYLGLLLLYTGIAFFKGNLWTFIFIPVVILVITRLVIIKEENYLSRAFGNDFSAYKMKVRRWI